MKYYKYEKNLERDNVYDIFGALVAKKCVCEGYAKAFQYLLNEVGIENTIVIGTGTNSKHQRTLSRRIRQVASRPCHLYQHQAPSREERETYFTHPSTRPVAGIAKGNDLTVQLLKYMEANPQLYPDDVEAVSMALLKMAADTETIYVDAPVNVKK